jgi:hypothetical protein
MKLSWQLPLIVHIITKYKITHYQYLILHNREFRSFGNRKNYFKSTTVTFQGNDVRIYLCLHCITVNNNNKAEYSLRESVSAQGREGRGFDSDPGRKKKRLYSIS